MYTEIMVIGLTCNLQLCVCVFVKGEARVGVFMYQEKTRKMLNRCSVFACMIKQVSLFSYICTPFVCVCGGGRYFFTLPF